MLPTKFRFIWPSGFRGEDFFRNLPIRNKNCLWRQCLLTDWDEMCNFHRGHSIDASYQVSIYLAKQFQRRFFRNQPIRNKNCMYVVAMFVNESGRNEQSLQRTIHICFLPSFGSFGHAVSEEKILFKATNQKQELPVVAMFVYRSGRNEHSLQRTLHICFLPNFSSFG